MSPTTGLLLRVGAAALARLPSRARKALAGRPVVLDGNTLDPTTQLMLRSLKLAGQDEIAHSGNLPRDREHMRRSAALLRATTLVGQVRDFEIPGPSAPIPVRHYRPSGDAIGALLVFFHGGGFVVGDLDTHDQACRQTCRDARIPVLSVDYRLAPEHKAPAAVEDCFAAYRWAVEHAVELGAAADRVAVGGDSAGGNLAAVVSQLARDTGAQPPALQFLIYPAIDATARRRSREVFREGFYLTDEAIDWFHDQYLGGSGVEDSDPRASPLLADDLKGLPPALITTADFDPLRDEGNEYADKLRASGVPTDLREQDSLTHGFYNLAPLGGGPASAFDELASALRAHLSR